MVSLADDAGPDLRNYRVDFSKLTGTFPDLDLRWRVRDGVNELVEAYGRHGLTYDDFTSARFVRLRRIRELLSAGLVDENLRRRTTGPFPDAVRKNAEELKMRTFVGPARCVHELSPFRARPDMRLAEYEKGAETEHRSSRLQWRKVSAESIEALIGQSYEDFELIISDNASTDGAGDVCRATSRKIPGFASCGRSTTSGAAHEPQHPG